MSPEDLDNMMENHLRSDNSTTERGDYINVPDAVLLLVQAMDRQTAAIEEQNKIFHKGFTMLERALGKISGGIRVMR